jgi:hypothetical protein
MSMPLMRAATLAVVLGLAACAATPTGDRRSAASTLPMERSQAGNPLHVVREAQELHKGEAGDVRVRVQYAWDYARGIAVRRSFFAGAGAPVEEDLPMMTLNATDPEREFAFSLVRADPSLATRITATTTLFGGFSFREAGHPACDQYSRCIHVVGSADAGQRHVLHAIVDLMTGTVVDTAYDPAMRGIAQDRKKGKPEP